MIRGGGGGCGCFVLVRELSFRSLGSLEDRRMMSPMTTCPAAGPHSVSALRLASLFSLKDQAATGLEAMTAQRPARASSKFTKLATGGDFASERVS